MSEGKNASFRCSQTDSFTAEKAPTIGSLPDTSYVKCRALPRNIMKIVPIISYKRTFLFCRIRSSSYDLSVFV